MRPRLAKPVRLQCEQLESREIPAANLMGVNIGGVEDWATDRIFADAMKSARRPSSLFTHEGAPPIDSKGWPATDASIVLWHGIGNMNGTYRLSFTGQADITTMWGATVVQNKIYSSTTNTTTAKIIYYPGDGAGLLLNLATTRRTANSSLNTGVTNIKLMRPIAPGSTTSYDPAVTFTQPLKDLVSKFSVVRMMDATGSNGDTDLNGVWSNRRPANYASQAAIGASRGMAWEYAVQFWNETDKDAWVNIPFPANDEYVTQLATMLKSTLEPGRKIYLEYSNELWNTWGPFPGVANRDAAVAEVQANPNSPLNYDGVYPTQDNIGWELARRRIALRSVQVSNIFRNVFGDSQMMTRVRPVMMSQLGWTEGWLARGLDYIEDYFNSSTYQSTPRPVSYYLYGAGGSAYEDPNWTIGTNITVDQIFATMPYNFDANIRKDMDWVASFGLKRIAYEGGPSLDNIVNNLGVPTSTLEAAWSDPRMRTELVQNHNTWTAAGGDLLMYFASTGGCQWGLTKDPFTLDTQKMRAIADLNAASAVAVNYGKLAPADLSVSDFNIPSNQGHIDSMKANSLTQNWNGSTFRLGSAGNYSIRATATASNGGRVEIFVDGKSFGTWDVPTSGETSIVSLGNLSAGVHGIVLHARSGTFGLSKVSIFNSGALPATPISLTATVLSSIAIRVNWIDQAINETMYVLERATTSTFTSGFTTFNLAANTNQYSDGGLASGVTYHYRVRATNAAGYSSFSNTEQATTFGNTGLTTLIFDNANFTGTSIARTDGVIDFFWPESPAANIGADSFSVKWTGRVQAVETGSYIFRTYSDDGVRLWVNGQQLVNNWTNHAGTYDTATAITLTSGQRYDVRMEFFDNTGGAVSRLEWKRPGQSQFVVIPQTQLTPTAGGPILFTDSFDAGLGNWGPSSGTWGMVASYAGRSKVSNTTSSTESLSIAATVSWSNYSTSMWVNLVNMNGGVGILGRVTDKTHYYQLEIKKNTAGQTSWFLNARDGNAWSQLASGTIAYTAGTWVKLRLTMVGNQLVAESSTNGNTFTQLGSATDSRYATGRIGMRAFGSAAYFDEAVVQGV